MRERLVTTAVLIVLVGTCGSVAAMIEREQDASALTIDLATDQYVSGRLAPGDRSFNADDDADWRIADDFVFQGMQGQVIRISVEARNPGELDPLLLLVDEGLQWFVGNDDDSDRNSCLAVTLPHSGWYVVTVTSSSARQGPRTQYGAYSLMVVEGGGPGCNTTATRWDPTTGQIVGGNGRAGSGVEAPPSSVGSAGPAGSDSGWSGSSIAGGESIGLRIEAGPGGAGEMIYVEYDFRSRRHVEVRYREWGSDLKTWDNHLGGPDDDVRQAYVVGSDGGFACAEARVFPDDRGGEPLFASARSC